MQGDEAAAERPLEETPEAEERKEDHRQAPPEEVRRSSESAARAVPAGLSERALMGVCVLGIAFLCVQILMFGFGRDQGIYAMVADRLLRGKMPYRDAWDFK